MAKEELVECEGTVVELLPDVNFKIELDNGNIITAYAAGNLRKHRIRILTNDRVTVELSMHDLTNGRVVKRL